MGNPLVRFHYKETLNSNPLTKSACLLGSIDGKDAIVTLERLMFKLDNDFFHSLDLKEVRQLESNDVYSWNVATVNQDLESKPTAKVNLIYPATETHIKKYRAQKKKVVVESPEDYQRVVVPYIQKMTGDRLKWVHNILYNGAEADRVVYRDDDKVNGFVLLPDMKWDGKTLGTLYLMAIVLRTDLASIRDLKPEHVPFLKHIKRGVLTAVYNMYGIQRDELKIYFHYQPSYYHLHIHVANVNHEQMDFGKSLLMDNVIDQLQFMPQGFAQATLSYSLGERHELCDQLTRAGSP